jgi:hypothetical protein
MSKVICKFSFNGKQYPIVIKWTTAFSVLPEKFDIEILKLFVDDQLTQQTASRLLVDDELALRLFWYYLEPQVEFNWDKFLELLDEEPEAVENFREAFWSAVVNFSSPQKKGILGDMWKMLKKEMKQLSLDTDKSSKSPSESSPEE